MTRVLITGITGFIGRYLLKTSPDGIIITGTFHNPPSNLPEDLSLFHLNLEESIPAQLQNQNPDIIIHTAAVSSLALSEKAPDKAKRNNGEATGELANWCSQRNIRLVYLSTDIVFDGHKAPYSEKDDAEPVNVYGMTKLAGEQMIIDQCANFAICRLALVLGRGLGGRQNFIDWFINQLEQNQTLRLFSDEYRTPSPVEPLAHLIWNIALNKQNGIFHCFGNDKIDRYTLGLRITEYLGKDKSKLVPVSVKDMTDYPRPVDVSLKTIRKNNQSLPGITQQLSNILS